MAIDFPNRPESGDVYSGPNGVSYTFDGIKWIGQEQSSSGGAGLPDQTGQVGKFLTTDGNGNASWADAQGPRGDAATITLGTVTTGLPGSSVVINNTGDSADAVFNFTVPRGDQGLKGDTGLKGDQGDRGFRGEQGVPGEQGEQGEQGDPGPQGEQGLRGEQGEQGAPGQQGEQGAPGQQGEQGVPGQKGDQGEPGNAGAQGEQGAPGQQGEQGVPGQKGDQGEPGNDGAQGVPGSPGAAGADGAKGDPGDTGPRGEKGDQGIPGNDSTVAGPKGDTGDQGVSVTLQGTKATIADLPATGSAGHGWIVTTGNGSNHLDGSLWFWNVTDGAWNDIGPIVGPQGDKGDPGDQGAKGDQGEPGNDGAPGAAGAKGDTGETGPQGDPGLPGETGQRGEQGLPGEPGQQGEQGVPGEQGEQGIPGEKGDQGLPGEPGQQGEQGVPGQQGEQGVPGVPGQGVSTGGTIGQVLTKLSSNDYDTGWIDQIDSTDRLVNGDQQLVLRGNGYLEFPDATVQTTAWTGLSAAEVTVSAVAPDLAEGALWYNSTDGRTYVKYGALWVDANPPVVPHASTYLDGLVVEGTGITTLAPDADVTIHDITFTADGRIQLPLGGDIVDSSDRSLLGGANDRLVNDNNTVVLGANGVLTIPGAINGPTGIEIATERGTVQFGHNLEAPGVASHFHINKVGSFDLFFGDDSNYVKLPYNDGVEIGANANVWRFGTDGRLTLPDASPIIRDDGGVSFINFNGGNGELVLGTSGLDNVVITVNDDGQGEAIKTWKFKTNGGLEFPDGTIQATAYSSIYPYTVSATPPEANNLWFNIVDGRMYVNIYDEGTLWVDANPPVVPPASTYLDGLAVEGTTISTTEVDADITVQAVTFTADGRIQLPLGGDIVDSLGSSVLGKSVVERTVVFPLGAVGDTRGTIALTPAGETYICVEDYSATGRPIWKRIVDVTVDPQDSNLGDGSVTWTSRGDLTLETVRAEGYTGDCDVNIYAADDIFIEANGDDVNITAANEVSITTDSDDGDFEWRFGDDGNITLPEGSVIGETATTTVITPPGALPGQSLVIRPTAVVNNLSASGFIEPGVNLTITLTNNGLFYTGPQPIPYAITGATAQQLGINSLTGQFPNLSPSNSVPQTTSIILPIPQYTSATTFTLTIDLEGYIFDGATITVTDNGVIEDSHVHLVAGNPATTDIYLGDDDQYVKIEKNGGDVVIGTGTNTNHWRFGDNGALTFPDATVQTTAYTGAVISDTAPSSNALWYNSTDGRTYVKYNNVWTDANPPVVAPVSTYLSGLTIDEQTISSVDSASPDVKIAGNLLPDSDLTYDLGSATNQWNSLHVKSSTIYMSGRALSLTSEGLKVDGGAAISVLDGGVAATWLLPV